VLSLYKLLQFETTATQKEGVENSLKIVDSSTVHGRDRSSGFIEFGLACDIVLTGGILQARRLGVLK